MDYKKIGLKVGLEIHQQLEGKKLFCNCPAEIIDTEPSQILKRNLRAVAGETGVVDEAAMHEHGKEKHFLYYSYDESCCLVEHDEEPPHSMNNEALETCLMVAKLVKAKLVDEIQVMRKTVVDGSNVSGFQRTALIGVDGCMKTSEGKISIPFLCLEEDAAKIIEKTDSYSSYNLSRLGIPLIEIATGPDIKTPEGAKEAAEMLGMILRSTKRVKRGLGTIRQDVNVSIKGGERIEIKGAQDLKMVPTLVKNEILRQQNLLKIMKLVPKKEIKDVQIDLGLKKCESKVVQSAFKNKGVVYGVKLEGFKGFLGAELQPGKRLGTELSGYAKVKAGVGGLFHSDELPKYGITEKDVASIRKKLKCGAKDGFILIADGRDKVSKGLSAAVWRANQVKKGVLNEVRNANPDGTTSFLRPMPGAARMYPETDVKPSRPFKVDVPELIVEKASRIKEYGLGKDLADLLAKSHKVSLFEGFVKKFKKLKPAFIAEVMLPKLIEIKRRHDVDTNNISDKELEELFFNLNKGLPKQVVEEVIIELAKGNDVDYSKYKGVSDKELMKEIKKIVSKNKNVPFGSLMGKCMAEFRGKVDGKKVSEVLKKLVK